MCNFLTTGTASRCGTVSFFLIIVFFDYHALLQWCLLAFLNELSCLKILVNIDLLSNSVVSCDVRYHFVVIVSVIFKLGSYFRNFQIFAQIFFFQSRYFTRAWWWRFIGCVWKVVHEGKGSWQGPIEAFLALVWGL